MLGYLPEALITVTEKVVVAMSGGVDSSVAALLLQRQGYDVVGVTMKLYSLEEADLPAYYQGCCTLDDVEDARRVCAGLGVPHYVLNVQREFETFVIDYFCAEYSKGRTPHPCIACNDKIKFNFLMTRAAVLEAQYVATGHYARIERSPQGLVLKKGIDAGKGARRRPALAPCRRKRRKRITMRPFTPERVGSGAPASGSRSGSAA